MSQYLTSSIRAYIFMIKLFWWKKSIDNVKNLLLSSLNLFFYQIYFHLLWERRATTVRENILNTSQSIVGCSVLEIVFCSPLWPNKIVMTKIELIYLYTLSIIYRFFHNYTFFKYAFNKKSIYSFIHSWISKLLIWAQRDLKVF